MFHKLHKYRATDLIWGDRHEFWVGHDDGADDCGTDFTDSTGRPTHLGWVDARDQFTRDAVCYVFGIEHEAFLALRRLS